MYLRVTGKILRNGSPRDIFYIKVGESLFIHAELLKICREKDDATFAEKAGRGHDEGHIVPLDVKYPVHFF